MVYHRFRNNDRVVIQGNEGWDQVEKNGLLNIGAHYNSEGLLVDQTGHTFTSMVSTSYLGLDVDRRILEGAKAGIDAMGCLLMGSVRLRVGTSILLETEDALSRLFGASVLTNVSTGMTADGMLPFISSGHMTNSEPLITVFDKHCHFCLNQAKPICADEAEVLTAPHNDINYLEDICKQNPRVAYICDGIYSTGDKAPVQDLLSLQEKYGLFLFFDDSHGISVFGSSGEGYVRSSMAEVGERTMIVGSLAKAFGARGSVLMTGVTEEKIKILQRYGGGIGWSQCLSSSDCGAILASISIHSSAELNELQEKLQRNIELADNILPTLQKGENFSIRIIPFGDAADAVAKSRALYENGFLASAVFFPVVERGRAGLRIMLRANMTSDEIHRFADVISNTAT